MTTLTRRRLLALLPAATLPLTTLHAQSGFFKRKPVPKAGANPFVYLATDTSRPGAKGIYVARFDGQKGEFSTPMLAAETLRPVFLALNQVPGKRVLYATNEGDARTSSVSTFLIDPATGSLKLVGQTPTAGAGPCFISVDATGKFAYIANYNGGTVTAYRVQPDGTLSQPMQCIDFHGPAFGAHGPAPRQDGPHPHSATISPDNRFLIVNDLGNDIIVTFPILPDGHLGSPTLHQTRPGSGPRHLAFHPNARWAYGVDELSNHIDCYLWNTTHAVGSSTEATAILTDTEHSVSTLDASFHGVDTAAEIVVSPDGFFVYVSNRGENTIAVFHIDQMNGSLKFVQRISTGGKGPRHFTLDPAGKWLICGNQDSASVTVFARNAATGQLSGPSQTLALESPVFTMFL